MSCFAGLESLLVWIIVVWAGFALVRLLLSAFGAAPFQAWPNRPFAPAPGAPAGFLGIVIAALDIVFWALMCIAIVYLIFGLFSCLLGAGGGLRLPRF